MCQHCDSDADCTGALPYSTKQCGSYPLANGGTASMCFGCKTDADCAAGVLKGCDPVQGICSRCTSDAECCMPGMPCPLSCELATGQCRCGSTADCRLAWGGKLYVCK